MHKRQKGLKTIYWYVLPTTCFAPLLETIDGHQIYSCLPSRAPIPLRQQTRSSAPWQSRKGKILKRKRETGVNHAGLTRVCVYARLCSVVLVAWHSDLPVCSTLSWIERGGPCKKVQRTRNPRNPRNKGKGNIPHRQEMPKREEMDEALRPIKYTPRFSPLAA